MYVLDGGYDLKHDEVADRITYGRSIVLNGCDGLPNYKHGTSVASAIIGKTVGVAKNATVIGVEAGTMDSRFCHGWVAMQRALFWTINDIYLRKREERSVVNISWSDKHPKGCKLINFFVDQLHLMGVSVVVAAGNYETDDINRCPLNSSTAITVASMDMFMSISPFSNYGPAIDLFAPGGHLDLARAFYRNKMREVHGTSYAAPVVAGSIACLISAEGYLPPEEMRQRLLELGTKDALIETRGSPNIIVYNGLGF